MTASISISISDFEFQEGRVRRGPGGFGRCALASNSIFCARPELQQIVVDPHGFRSIATKFMQLTHAA
jgi:hypothetical protein